MKDKLNLAWVEDAPRIVEENNDFFYPIANIDSFKDSEGYLDFVTAREHLIKTHHYDGIILDDMFLTNDIYPSDGMEAGEHLLCDIRSYDINKETPVIIYATRGMENLIERFKELGANFYLCKHFQILSDDMKQGVYTLNPTKKSLDLKNKIIAIPKSSEYEIRETAIELMTAEIMLEGMKAMHASSP
ncbi:MAG: hypothetical protein PHH54_00165 [Candidatus Nanoarchaeia archaeon]|nr:hypothetical protein [Candidatus Nanoarchaeia archaeon]MDD5740376.1 hypothetical protein [Candidatus Nanoarchaeia archaeon]